MSWTAAEVALVVVLVSHLIVLQSRVLLAGGVTSSEDRVHDPKEGCRIAVIIFDFSIAQSLLYVILLPESCWRSPTPRQREYRQPHSNCELVIDYRGGY